HLRHIHSSPTRRSSDLRAALCPCDDGFAALTQQLEHHLRSIANREQRRDPRQQGLQTLLARLIEPVVIRRQIELAGAARNIGARSEEHTSELQSRENLV